MDKHEQAPALCDHCGQPKHAGCDGSGIILHESESGGRSSSRCPGYAEYRRLRALRAEIERLAAIWPVPPRYAGATLEPHPAANQQQREAFGAARDYLAELITADSPRPRSMVFTGPNGAGKTHAACALARELMAAGQSVCCCDEGALVWRVRQAMKPNDDCDGPSEFELVEAANSCDLLLLDDAGSAKRTEHTEELLRLIIQQRYGAMKPTLLTTTRSAEELLASQHARDILDRILEGEGNNVIRFPGPSLRRPRP